MKELYRTVYGSHLYGTATPKSDYDYKVVFLPDLRDMLLGKQLKSKQVSTSDDKSKNTHDDVDVQYVPLQTFARDYFGGQSYAYEVAQHFLGQPLTLATDARFASFVRELVDKFTTRDVKAMVGYAWSQAEKYALKGKRQRKLEDFRVQVINTLEYCGLRAKETRVADIADHFSFTEFHPYIKLAAVEQHLPNDDARKLLAVQVLNKSVLYTVKVQELLDRLDDHLAQYGHRVKAAAKNVTDGSVDWKSLYHALRITMQAKELLSTGKMNLPFTGERLSVLMKVRSGDLSFPAVKKMFESEVTSLEDALVTTGLQEKTEKLTDEFDDFLYRRLRSFYDLGE